ncbi:MAG: DsrE family protein [Candidatus Geothermarchaeales archaeon]
MTNGMKEKDGDPEHRILVVLLTGKSDLFRARQALVFAKNARKVGILQDVRFLFFGPGVELLDTDDPDTHEIRKLIEELHQQGITVSACVSNLRQYGLANQARKHDVFAEPASVLISELVRDGYQVITF